jgi:hypothetical protein
MSLFCGARQTMQRQSQHVAWFPHRSSTNKNYDSLFSHQTIRIENSDRATSIGRYAD